MNSANHTETAVPLRHSALSLLVRGRLQSVAATERPGGPDLVVFLHGLGCARAAFSYALASAPVNSQTRLVALDFPGHGDTPPVVGGGDLIEAYAEVTSAVVRHLAPRTTHIVGHSMGGAVAVLAAGMLQGVTDIGAVVSVEGNLTADDCRIASRRIAESNASDFAAFVADLHASPEASRRAWGSWMARADPLAVRQAAASLVAWSDSGGLAERWQYLANTAYVWGQRSGFPEHLRPILPNHRSIPDSGHFPMIDQPTAFNAVLADLIADVHPDRAGPG